jgi:Cu/Ag efflux protein CusF
MLGTIISLASISCAAATPEATKPSPAPKPAAAPVVAAAATPAAPASNAPPSMQREEVHEVSATVSSVDQSTRMLGLKGDDGSSTTFQVGPEVKNFPQIKVGDKVVVSYYRGIAAELQPKGTPLSKKVDTIDLAATAQPGTKPGAAVGTATIATVVIEKVDTKANTVSFKRPDGVSRTLPVKSPEGQEFIRKLKTGDQVEVLYAEAVAIEVRKQ